MPLMDGGYSPGGRVDDEAVGADGGGFCPLSLFHGI